MPQITKGWTWAMLDKKKENGLPPPPKIESIWLQERQVLDKKEKENGWPLKTKQKQKANMISR